MGSSHFINSTGSLWGLERPELEEYSVVLGGRQRGNGQQQTCFLTMDDQGRFELLSEAEANLPLVLNTQQRQAAWADLPAPAGTFTDTEGERLVSRALRSRSSYQGWMKECRRLKVILDTPDGKLMKFQEKRKGWEQE